MFQKCADYKASEIPTFARTDPPDTQVPIQYCNMSLRKRDQYIIKNNKSIFLI